MDRNSLAQGRHCICRQVFWSLTHVFLISAVPENQRPALFQSLLYEAAGRTVNLVNGAVGPLQDGEFGTSVKRRWKPSSEAARCGRSPNLFGATLETDEASERTDVFKLQDPSA
ncbi:hypothetical protein HAX54_047492 [Datura stramonium]|uniref:LOB domain-containing protein n=1 Tax=Datura stramonium TaxID=4076 RepID=A0ABS8WIC1_DATST|nr:hypothetical protein [Datura stramonium]